MSPNKQALALASVFLSSYAWSEPTDDLNEIRQQIDKLCETYEVQLKALEKRLENAEALAEENRSQIVEKQNPGAAKERTGGLTSSAFNPAI